MLLILAFSFLGILLGFIAGILPGIHPNQIFVMLISFLPFLSSYPPSALLSFVLAVAVSNIFFNYIPSIFFSVPDSNTVMNVLPGHRMVLDGKGLDALFISLVGAFFTLIVCVFTLPLLLYIIPIIHQFFYPYIHILLIGLTGVMVYKESTWKKRFFSFLLFILSGLFGILTLNSKLIPSDQALFPGLTGMFGIAGLLMCLKEVVKLPHQRTEKNIETGSIGKMILSGLIAGLLIGILPGAGESQAGVLVDEFMRLNQKEFLGSLSGINMSNLFFSIVSLYSFGKIRSGAAAAIDDIIFEFDINQLLFSIGIILFTGGITVILTWFTGKKLLKSLEKINYKLVSLLIIIFTVAMIIFFTGLVGLGILVISTCLGLLSLFLDVKRTSNMGYLMIPTIIYFSGLTHVINTFLF